MGVGRYVFRVGLGDCGHAVVQSVMRARQIRAGRGQGPDEQSEGGDHDGEIVNGGSACRDGAFAFDGQDGNGLALRSRMTVAAM